MSEPPSQPPYYGGWSPQSDPTPPTGIPIVQPPSPIRLKRSKWPAITIAVLAVAVIGLGTALVAQPGTKTPSVAPTAASTVTTTATVTASAKGPVTVTKTVTETKTSVETVTEAPTSEDTSVPPVEDGPIQGKVGTALELSWTQSGSEVATGSVTVNSAKHEGQFDGDYDSDIPKNGAFLVVDVSYSVTTGKYHYNPYDWTIKDPDGVEYESTIVFNADLNELHSGTIGAGDKARGVIVYDVPKGVVMKLTYTVGYGDLGAVWNIPA